MDKRNSQGASGSASGLPTTSNKEKPSGVRTIGERAGQRGESPWFIALCFGLMIVGLQLAAAHRLGLSEWSLEPAQNPGLMEALSWQQGRLDLPERLRDTALFDGKIYNVFPPLFTFFSYIAVKLYSLQSAGSVESLYGPWLVLLLVVPLPVVGFWAFYQVTRQAAWAATLTGYLILGTPLLPTLENCKSGSINSINHVLATIGLLLVAGDVLGRRRMWPASIGLVIAIWSRQLTVFCALAAIWIAWKHAPRRALGVGLVASSVLFAGGTMAVLNKLKFGSPIETGYRYIYDGGRESDWYGKRLKQHGLFSAAFLKENAYYMNVAPPRFRTTKGLGIVQDNDTRGVGIWWTCPLLLGVFFGIRRKAVPPGTIAMVLCTIPIAGVLLFYHCAGEPQVGYFHYALDFVPVWLVVIAPWAAQGRARWFTLSCLGWSLLYFHLLFANPV